MTLLALIGSEVAAGGRGETRLAANLRSTAVAEAAADGAVYDALFHLFDGSPGHWAADGRWRHIRTPQAAVDVMLVDERRKLALNHASLPLLRGLILAAGIDPGTAAILSTRITDWRKGFGDPQSAGAGIGLSQCRPPVRVLPAGRSGASTTWRWCWT